jgi:hypothetical protein
MLSHQGDQHQAIRDPKSIFSLDIYLVHVCDKTTCVIEALSHFLKCGESFENEKKQIIFFKKKHSIFCLLWMTKLTAVTCSLLMVAHQVCPPSNGFVSVGHFCI